MLSLINDVKFFGIKIRRPIGRPISNRTVRRYSVGLGDVTVLLRPQTEVVPRNSEKIFDLHDEDPSRTTISRVREGLQLIGAVGYACCGEKSVIYQHHRQTSLGNGVPVQSLAGNLDPMADQKRLLTAVVGVHIVAHSSLLSPLDFIASCNIAYYMPFVNLSSKS